MHAISKPRLTGAVAGERLVLLQPMGLPMIVTVFRSRLMPGLQAEYVALVDRMTALASTMPGYISHKGFFAEDSERCTIVEFESEEPSAPGACIRSIATPSARDATSITKPTACKFAS
jgi:heme-degrading monooxygenase HmoA